MSYEHIALFLLMVIVIEIIGTIGGFGSSMLFVPFASFFFDFQSVLGLTAAFHVLSNLTKLALFKEGIDRYLLIYLGIPSIIFVVIGAFISKSIESTLLEIILAIFLIVISLALLIKQDLKLKINKANTISGGVLSGFLAGLLGTGGAIRGIALSSFTLSASVFVATSAMIDLGVDLSRSVVYAFNGYIHWEELKWLPALLVTTIIGTWIGKRLLNKISAERFRTIVLLLICATGVGSLIRLTLF